MNAAAPAPEDRDDELEARRDGRIEAAEAANDLASAKESGAIEYSARVLLALRSVKNEPDLVEVRVAKNKHGPSNDRVYLSVDRIKMTLTERDAPTEPAVSAARAARARERVAEDAATVAVALAASQGDGVRALRAEVRARSGGMSSDRIDAAVAYLGASVLRVPAHRGAVRLYLDGLRVPNDVMAAVQPDSRAAVMSARHPQPEVAP